ncbi:Trypsin [compost metagenome]
MKSLKFLNISGLLALTVVVGCTSAKNDNQNVTLKSDSSIIGGQPSTKGSAIATSTVALVGVIIDENNQKYQYTCTGSLIRPNVVLTAGHCVPAIPKGGRGAVLVVFTQDLNQASEKDIRYVTDLVQHPDYALDKEDEDARVNKDAEVVVSADTKVQNQEEEGELQNANDFAIMKFEGSAPQGYKVANILTDETLLTEGAVVTLAGFGFTDGVNKVSDGKMNEVQVTVDGHYGNEVVLDQSQGKGACHGDSGGPAFLEVKGVQYLWGVTSRGIGKDGKDDCSLLSLYGKVFSQKDFITKALKQISAQK